MISKPSLRGHRGVQPAGRGPCRLYINRPRRGTGASRTFDFTGTASKDASQAGRIGLRYMDDRRSRYGNFKIWASEYVGGGGNVAGGAEGRGSG